MSPPKNGFMSQFTRRPWVRALSLVLALSLSGCHSWRPAGIRLGPDPHSERLRVTTSDWQRRVDGARIVDDTLLAGTAVIPRRGLVPFSVPLIQVTAIEEEVFSTGKTIWLVGGTLALAAGVAAYIAVGNATAEIAECIFPLVFGSDVCGVVR